MPQTLDREVSPAALAWFGNAAKMRIIERITADKSPKRVFDYGAGSGAGWARTLADHPEIELTCYEPNPRSAEALRRAVHAARVFSDQPDEITGAFDYIVSFSVFEHVADRAAYFRHARRLLKPGGRFFLNYDDGHFREPGNLLDALRNRIAPILPAIGLRRYYQARVHRADADRLAAQAGFELVDARYDNVEDLKALAKTIPEQDHPAFAQMWLDLEERLNSEFAVGSRMHLGDTTNLWRVMASRTLELTAA